MSRDSNRRSTSNSNSRGSSEDRRRRREWLVETYRADMDVYIYHDEPPAWGAMPVGEHPLGWWGDAEVLMACRCYRCGHLLTTSTVTVDRIIPGCKGGTYRRDNIRPSCESCMTITGSALGHEQKAAKKGAAKA